MSRGIIHKKDMISQEELKILMLEKDNKTIHDILLKIEEQCENTNNLLKYLTYAIAAIYVIDLGSSLFLLLE